MKQPKKIFKGDQKKKSISGFTVSLLQILLFFLLLGLIIDNFSGREDEKEASFAELTQFIQQGEVENITVRGEEMEIVLLDGTIYKSKKERGVGLSETLVNYGVSSELLSKTNIIVKNETGFAYYAGLVLPFLFPILLIGLLIWFFVMQMKNSGGLRAFSFGDSRARVIHPNDDRNRITFNDVAGNIEAKQELQEIVEFLRYPKKFFAIGAKIPKGVLLDGAPGTGKTLLARAVAGEARVPYYYLSGSEFVEMFVGVGASRVRDLFRMAKENAPAIIFIDEIDAVGRHRGIGMGGGNDEREQTLNQILVEMDGFEPHEKVIVLAATNRSDVLDMALLRPGRFDRRVTLELPDRKDRGKIIQTHLEKKPCDDSINIQTVAERTAGFSGADLESLANEAAILAARNNRKKISQSDMLNSIEKVMIGPERRSHLLSKKEREITAYHEAGHAIISSVLEHADPVQKISIISRGKAGGFTMLLPLEEVNMPNKRKFEHELASMLGGYAAEEIIFGTTTTGPSSDLQRVTALAEEMVVRYGMSGLGPITFDKKLRTAYGEQQRQVGAYSEAGNKKIDTEVHSIVSAAFKLAHTTIKDNMQAFQAIAKELLEKETLEREEYEGLLAQHGIHVKADQQKGVDDNK